MIYVKALDSETSLDTIMEKIDVLRKHGLFDARVPRYTSYPPANHFENGVGQRHQLDWLSTVAEGSDVSVYIHIPFCKRLCWFCACRTQGTKTLRPVEAYVDILRQEIEAVRATLPSNIRMARLHLGGGTPTILTPEIMTNLLLTMFTAFTNSEDFEFSVEIDPTEASEPLLKMLIDFGMNRASLGVQDFAPVVQDAIGRHQSLEQTQHVVTFLRTHGIAALNLDLLYGLPHQTAESFEQTLEQIIAMQPDRLAIYGYAHVPWMSKRQVLINEDDLPDSARRFQLAKLAQEILLQRGYGAIGIDHFALPTDSLSMAQQQGTVRRNFQGYTDDQCKTLIGFGASSISRFEQGYMQNVPATSAYQDRITQTQFAGYKGYEITPQDMLMARIVEDLLCRFSFNETALRAAFPDQIDAVRATAVSLMRRFGDVFFISANGLEMEDWARPLVRIIAQHVDTFSRNEAGHSAAI